MLQHVSDMRLPGITFRPAPHAASRPFPPLDVAAFVGFAERGPLHTPVSIEDVDTYRAIFGSDLALARVEGKQTAYAHLSMAVSTFFANGGRRCLVVRVTGNEATATSFRLPGMISLDVDTAQPQLTQIQASFPGRWSSRLRLGSRLQATPLPPTAFTLMGKRSIRWETGSAPQAILAGDLLRLTFSDQTQWLFPVTTVAPIPLEQTQTAVSVEAAQLWQLITANSPALIPSPTQIEKLTLSGSEPLLVNGVVNVVDQQLELEISGIDAERVQEGDILWLKDNDGSGFIFPITHLQTNRGVASPLESTLLMSATAILNADPNQSLPFTLPWPHLEKVERLRFDLHIWEDTERRPSLIEMAFNNDHPHFWGHLLLLESSSLFAHTLMRSDTQAKQAAQWHHQIQAGERIETNDKNGRLQMVAWAGLFAPLSLHESRRVHLPLDMVQLLTENDVVTATEENVGSDDLNLFQADVFIDPDLVLQPASLNISPGTLLTLAFQKHYVDNRRLRGMHSLLFAEEVALISIPDAVHRHWALVPAAPPVAEVPSPLPSTPTTNTFINCVRPAIQEDTVDNLLDPLPDTPDLLPALQPLTTLADDSDALLQIQRTLITLCQARQDVVGILSLPEYFEKRHCIEWLELLRQQLGLPKQRQPQFGDLHQVVDLSYTAVYHPWLLVAPTDNSHNLRAIPADGAICGLIAARERARQVWVAPANEPIQGILGLTPFLSQDDWGDLFELQLNIIRAEPRDFRPMSAHTLSDNRLLLQLPVRRLLILLRKMALERGLDFVFENNDTRLWQSAKHDLEIMLQQLFSQGAFAGATPQEAFRVITDKRVNTPQRIDQGQFVAQIQVAPSQPMEFIVVQLLRSSEDSLNATEVR